MSKRLISVIVTTYNRTFRLEQNVRALLNQTLEEDVKMEIIIIDDCSNKENKDKISLIANESDLISLIINPFNKGLSGSRNVGAEHAKGEYLLFLDDDIMVEPLYVMGHLSLLSPQSGVATVGSLRFPPELTRFNNLMKFLSSKELRQRNFENEFLNDLPAQYLGGGICGMRAKDFLKVGGFSESFTFYGGEDIQMGISLKQIGVRIMYAPDAKAEHYDAVYIDRYRLKYIEAFREGLRLILSSNPHFFDKSVLRFLLPAGKNERLKDRIIKLALKILLNVHSELILRSLAKITNRCSLFYSVVFFQILFACWMNAGLKDKRRILKSEVTYSN